MTSANTIKLSQPFKQLDFDFARYESQAHALYSFVADPNNYAYRVLSTKIWPEGMVRGDYHATPHWALEPTIDPGTKQQKRTEYYTWSGLGEGLAVDQYLDQYLSLAEPLVRAMQDTVNQYDSRAYWAVQAFEVNRITPGGWIKPHRDAHFYAATTQRVHLVLSTNPKAVLIAEGESRHWPRGSCFIFNNLTLHEIQNLGTTDRTHLVVDLKPSWRSF